MLTVTQVSKSFGDLTAVNDLSFHVNRGEALGLVGQNGAGKSTTFKMLLNFLTPDTGTITFNGHVHVQSPFLGQKAQSVKERLADGLTVKGDGTRIRRQKI